MIVKTQKSLEATQKSVEIVKKRVDEQESRFQSIAKELRESRRENNALKEKLLQMDTYIRRENLKFAGIKEEKKGKRVEGSLERVHILNIDFPICLDFHFLH